MPAAAARGARERALGDEGPLPDARLGEAAAARLVVGARDGGEVDAQRPGERPMGRQPFAAMQAPRGYIGAERFDDAFIDRAGPVAECREPIHTILILVLECMADCTDIQADTKGAFDERPCQRT